MLPGVISICIGLVFVYFGVLDVVVHWGDFVGRSVGTGGAAVGILLLFAGTALLRRWPNASHLVIAAVAGILLFTLVAGLLRYMGNFAIGLSAGTATLLLVTFFSLRRAGRAA